MCAGWRRGNPDSRKCENSPVDDNQFADRSQKVPKGHETSGHDRLPFHMCGLEKGTPGQPEIREFAGQSSG
jgi:hypothetical protein